MKLFIAGGVGEHGRSCFMVQSDTMSFLVDCGKMADTPEDPYPRLTTGMIKTIDAVFLTHSHADHTGSLPWLFENGFDGTVIAADGTLRQLPFDVKNSAALNEICPTGSGHFRNLSIGWGRSGHCAGSVWYLFSENQKTIFLSGDYTEDTLVYAFDPIMGMTADLAVLDCVYGYDKTTYNEACDKLVRETGKLLELHGTVRSGQTNGIIFISDPQLHTVEAKSTAEQLLACGGKAVMTGTLERGSFSDALFCQGKMALLRYPVHLNYE